MVLACVAFLVSCVADREARRRESLIAIQQAFAKRDYEEAYRVTPNEINRDNGVKRPEVEATYWVGVFLTGGLELIAADDPSARAWYEPELMQRLSWEERERAGMIWMHKAADLGSREALSNLSLVYEYGRRTTPKDAELWRCFEAAMSDRSKYETCKQLEITRGYVTMAPAEQPALPPANP